MRLDCKAVAQKIKDDVRKEIAELGITPTLAVILVGNDSASQVYVRNKNKVCAEVGIHSFTVELPESSSQEDVEKIVMDLNEKDSIHGILVQLPLPKHLDSDKVIQLIDPRKDVDGLTLHNQALLAVGKIEDAIIPCTPKGVLTLIDTMGFELEGAHVTILGRSELFGKPMARLCLHRNATVSVCHSRTNGLTKYRLLKSSDVVIAAIGKPKEVKLSPCYDTALVIDVGINRTENGLVGDIDLDTIPYECDYTPVPGGVGLLTTASLLQNIVICYKKLH